MKHYYAMWRHPARGYVWVRSYFPKWLRDRICATNPNKQKVLFGHPAVRAALKFTNKPIGSRAICVPIGYRAWARLASRAASIKRRKRSGHAKR